MKVVYILVLASMAVASIEYPVAQDPESPAIIKAAVQAVAREYPDRTILLVLSEDDSINSATVAARTGLATSRINDAFVCTQDHVPLCRISGGDLAISVDAPVVTGESARIRVGVTMQRGAATANLSRQTWAVTLAKRGKHWLVLDKEIVLVS